MKSMQWPSALVVLPLALVSLSPAQRPGDRQNVTAINPAYSIEHIRPAAMNFPEGGMDWMADGRLVVASWKDPYEIHIIGSAITGATPKTATVAKFATGLSEVLGLKVVNDSIYVLEKDQLTLLLDHDKDGKADEYRAIAYDWTKSLNEKEYAVGLAYDGTWFYGIFGDPTVGSGTAVDPQPAGRQNGTLRIRRSDGQLEVLTGGMRVPGGIDMAFGNVWATETQGGYRVSHALYVPKKGRFYGRPVNPPSMYQPAAASTPKANPAPYTSPDQMAGIATPFSVNIPFKNTTKAGAGPVGLMRSPGNPMGLTTGPYAGQMLIPEVDKEPNGEVVRVFVEQTQDGEWQGAAFHFSTNTVFEGKSVFNLIPGPDGNLYAGGNGSSGAGWGRLTSVGLDRMKLTGVTPFDILAVRNLGSGSFEVQFTKPLAASLGANVGQHLTMQKWWDKLSNDYGCCRAGFASVPVASATVQTDRSKVLISVPGLTVHWIYYMRWADAIKSEQDETLWGTEAWYTLNAFGPATPVSLKPGRHSAGAIGRPYALHRSAAGLRVQVFFGKGAPYTARIADMQGRTLATHSGHGAEEFSFPRSVLPQGVYILGIRSGNETYSTVAY
jgi:cytochrome c